ncbi:M23 family metallopeptidase [Lysobacter ciconiae]|uniref:M23 family metallopeptidase n=1 Tax=Novilysobacter ciconiae TaxID=2781022 RepID=A0A7S6ZRV9_9GAMM|nr:M23 family metallopeptidase [Lysobacter ciconiae]QOW19054.1 M23 family metallopeptidase [Lysobacter ciconiae]
MHRLAVTRARRLRVHAAPTLAAVALAFALASLASVKAAPPAAGAADGSAAARVRIETTDDGYQAWADNPLPGPIEVRLRYRQRHNTVASPELPARATIPAGGSTVVAAFRAADPSRALDFDLILDSVPGNPSAQPRDVTYLLPLAKDAPVMIDQGFAGTYSHDDEENRYAIDFAVPVGTAVLAARDGVVMQVIDRHLDAPRNNTTQHRGAAPADTLLRNANLIRVLHDDGTMAVYAHLQRDGAVVAPGQRVRAGQHIGWSGNTGFSTGPHLHFAVQVNRGMRLVSLPFRMEEVSRLPSDSGACVARPGHRE